ncbi:hypothetical protein KY348_05705 [Candidatus Woesearchaeota archaeon]|nr:hypothetical protein [Candidatus Woesearchaeota archaeon]
MAKKVSLMGYGCLRCGHEWLPRNKNNEPKVCPKCKNPYWDRPKKNKKFSKKSENIKKAQDKCLRKTYKTLGKGALK